MGRKVIDMAGRVFGRLTVVERMGSQRYATQTKPLWWCVCSVLCSSRHQGSAFRNRQRVPTSTLAPPTRRAGR